MQTCLGRVEGGVAGHDQLTVAVGQRVVSGHFLGHGGCRSSTDGPIKRGDSVLVPRHRELGHVARQLGRLDGKFSPLGGNAGGKRVVLS